MCISADATPKDARDRTLQWQDTLMDLFFEDISPDGVHALSPVSGTEEYCKFQGITCEDGIVVEVLMQRRSYGNFNIYALPPSTQNLEITDCQQTFTFNTHALPPKISRLILRQNQIRGNVNFTCLPVTLEDLDLSDNKLKGYVDLTHLPRKMKTLHVAYNKFRQHTVWYDNLPEKIHTISLVGSSDLTETEFYEIRAVHPEKAVKYRSIFCLSATCQRVF